ncbi:MAG: hypothetical protein ACM3VW_10400 [Bacteroidota bacterium]
MTKHLPYLLLALALLCLTAACAQDAAAPLTGTVTFRSGQTLTGVIKAADLGIMDGTGVGTNLSGNGAIKININGQAQRVPAANIASIEATWVDKSRPEEPGWEISELKIVTKDGQTLIGKPGWHMHATNVSIQLPSGETKRVHAFPLAGPDFKPENLIAKIDLTATAAAVAPAPTAPATVEPVAPVVAAPATTAPAAAAPATVEAPVTAPATAAPVAAAPVTPVTPSPAATAPAAAAAVVTPAPTPVNAIPGQPIVVTVNIPGTEKKVNILLYVTLVDGQVQITPATP